LAKVASKLDKPNGLTFLMNPQEITEALQKTKVENIWGVGWATDKKIKRHKIETAYDFISCDLKSILKSSFNKNIFQTLEELCGVKHFEVGSENAHKKSIQSTRTFLQATNNKEILKGELSRNIEIACSELRQEALVAKRFYIFLKPKHKGQKYVEQSFELPNYTNLDTSVLKYIEHLFDKSFNLDNIIYKKSGVTMLSLIKAAEIPKDLFNENESLRVEENKISSLVDGIRNKFGFDSICLVSSIQSNNFRKVDYSRRHRNDNYIGGLPYPFLGVTN
jgi:nucleotidyltransferase/DNA polymerase involved in DNA repair